MASTFSPNLRLELIGTGEQQGTWGITTNTNLGTLLEEAIGGYVNVLVSNAGDTVLTTVNGGADESRNMVINLTGTISAARNVICPAIEKLYIVKNSTVGGFSVTFKVSGQTGVTVPNGTTAFLYVDGTDAVLIQPNILDGSITTAKLGGDITAAGKALLDDADASAQRTTLGLGTLATQNANNVNITGGSITNVTLPATPGDSILSARALSLPSYIGTPGNYLKASYPLIGGLPSLQIYGAEWNATNIPSASSGASLLRSFYGNGVWITAYVSNLIRRSADNGLTWSSISTPAVGTNSVGGIAHGNGVWIIIDSSNRALRSTDNGLTWSIAASSLAAVENLATDGAGVWIACGQSGLLYRSIDDGATWSTISSGTTNRINDIAFGNGAWVFVCSSNLIRRSTDSGSTWTTITSPFGGGNYNSVATDGAGTWLAGHADGVVRSTDNGVSFSAVASSPASLTTIATNGSGTWIASQGSTVTRRSTDNGVNWSIVNINPTGTSIKDIAFGNGKFLAVGVTSSMSSDGGASWTLCSAQFLVSLNSIARSSNAAIAISNSTFYSRSTDNGSSWSFVSTPIPVSMLPNRAAFGNSVFVICGEFSTNAKFARSSDNGLTWFDVSPTAIANTAMYRIATNGTGTWLAGGQSGNFYRSTNNGLSWGSIFTITPFGTTQIQAIAANGNTWIALAGTTGARSTDNGVTWTAISTGLGGNPYDIAYGGGVWVAVGTSTPFIRYSTDDGVTWATPSGIALAGQAYTVATDGQGIWVTFGSNATQCRISRDNGLTFSALPSAPLVPENTGSAVFFGQKIVAVQGRTQDGNTSATQFNAPPALANAFNFTYLYTGQ